MDSPAQDYVHDLFFAIIEQANAARDRANASRDAGPEARSFEEGRRLAYWEVVSEMQNLVRSFNAGGHVLDVAGFDPDRELFN